MAIQNASNKPSGFLATAIGLTTLLVTASGVFKAEGLRRRAANIRLFVTSLAPRDPAIGPCWPTPRSWRHKPTGSIPKQAGCRQLPSCPQTHCGCDLRPRRTPLQRRTCTDCHAAAAEVRSWYSADQQAPLQPGLVDGFFPAPDPLLGIGRDLSGDAPVGG